MTKKLGELLVETGAASARDVDIALRLQRGGSPERVGEILLNHKRVSAQGLARALSTQSGLPFVELPDVLPPSVVPAEPQRRRRAVVFRVEAGAVHVAVDDPSNVAALERELPEPRPKVIGHIAAADDLERALSSLSAAPELQDSWANALGAASGFSDEERRVLDGLERLARGEPLKGGSEKLEPGNVVASLVRLLLKKGVIRELELVDELARK